MNVGGTGDPTWAAQEDQDTGHFDLWMGTDGEVVRTHGRDVCAGDPCPLHGPSAHHLVTWPLRLRRVPGWPAERECPHGHWHPDPDDQAFREATRRVGRRTCEGCDGCCQAPGPSDERERER